jgi:hypothetical protein
LGKVVVAKLHDVGSVVCATAIIAVADKIAVSIFFIFWHPDCTGFD